MGFSAISRKSPNSETDKIKIMDLMIGESLWINIELLRVEKRTQKIQ